MEGSIDPALVKKAIFHVHLWALKWEYDRMFASSGKNNPTDSQVVDILNMWTLVEQDLPSGLFHQQKSLPVRESLLD